jgi:hypothetical protein
VQVIVLALKDLNLDNVIIQSRDTWVALRDCILLSASGAAERGIRGPRSNNMKQPEIARNKALSEVKSHVTETTVYNYRGTS